MCIVLILIYLCQEFPSLSSCPFISSLGRKNPFGACQVLKPPMWRCAGVACLRLNPPQHRFTFSFFKHGACPSCTWILNIYVLNYFRCFRYFLMFLACQSKSFAETLLCCARKSCKALCSCSVSHPLGSKRPPGQANPELATLRNFSRSMARAWRSLHVFTDKFWTFVEPVRFG